MEGGLGEVGAGPYKVDCCFVVRGYSDKGYGVSAEECGKPCFEPALAVLILAVCDVRDWTV